jgi:uncharacterized protein involved in exopolysaccharide biosynthesis
MIFARVFIPVFLLVFITSTVVTFISPETYASRTQIMLASNETASLGEQLVGSSNSVQRAIEDIQSQSILESVIGQLDLNEIWGEKYNAGVKLKSTDTMQLLKQRLEIRPVRNTRIIAITTYSEDRDEAADIANEIVKSYWLYLATNHPGLTIDRLTTFPGLPRLVEFAKPAIRPVRPNKVLNLAVGAAAGILLGAIAGGIVAGLASRSGRKANQV